MKIKNYKHDEYLPAFSCIMKGDRKWASVEKCLNTPPKVDVKAVKACAKKVG